MRKSNLTYNRPVDELMLDVSTAYMLMRDAPLGKRKESRAKAMALLAGVVAACEYEGIAPGTGKMVKVKLGTPLCCDPTSETYWSM